MKLIYTEKGLNLYSKYLKPEVVLDEPVSQISSVKPQSIKILQLTKQNNRSRMCYLKLSCGIQNAQEGQQQPSSTRRDHNNISGFPQFNLGLQHQNYGSQSSLSMKKIVSSDRLAIQQPIQMMMSNNFIKPLKLDRVVTPGAVQHVIQKKPSFSFVSDHSMKQHHVQSIRLKTGEWMQWKNMLLNQESVDLFNKTIYPKEPTQDEISGRLHRRMERNKEAVQNFQVQEKVKNTKLDVMNEQRGLRYDKNTDQFWQSFQYQKSLLKDHNIDQLKFRRRETKRLDEHNNKKYRKVLYGKPNLKLRDEDEFCFDKHGQLARVKSMHPLKTAEDLTISYTDL